MADANRRRLLKLGLAGAALTALPRVALARMPGDRRLVVFVLRGAMDGLAAVPPHGDPAYAEVRGTLALPAPGREGGILDLDGFYGLNPALEALLPLWRAGQMQVLHACATPYRERSHFDAQNVLETGGQGPSGAAAGWLNRALALTGGTGLAAGLSVPLILSGTAPVTTWAPQVMPPPDATLMGQIAALYSQDPLFRDALTEASATEAVAGAGGMAGTAGGGRQLGALVAGLARLMRDGNGPRIATIDVPGWDTHTAQGTDKGRLAAALRPLGQAIALLQTELGAEVWARTLVLAVTEFGRTAAPNGTGGTDHGTGGAALAFGGALAGAKVQGQWPGLGRDRLYQGRDLAPTTDLRRLFAAALTSHLGLPARDVASHVFPEAPGLAALPDVIRS